MKILLFGGTTEGRELARELVSLGHTVTLCVATKLGEAVMNGCQDPCTDTVIRSAESSCSVTEAPSAVPEPVPGHIEILAGRKDGAQMEALIRSGSFDLCVDATHPYAVLASRTISEACGHTGLPYLRYVREESPDRWKDLPGLITAESAKDAADILSGRAFGRDRILLTTGAKEAEAYADLDMSRLFIRILPSEESRRACLRAGFPEDHIVSAMGPFSEEENLRLMRQLQITLLVTKESGRAGGFPEKLAAARRLGVRVLVIRRPSETGMGKEELMGAIHDYNTDRNRLRQ